MPRVHGTAGLRDLRILASWILRIDQDITCGRMSVIIYKQSHNNEDIENLHPFREGLPLFGKGARNDNLSRRGSGGDFPMSVSIQILRPLISGIDNPPPQEEQKNVRVKK